MQDKKIYIFLVQLKGQKTSQQTQPDAQLMSGTLVAPLGLILQEIFILRKYLSVACQCLLLSDIWPERSDQNASWHLRVKGWFTGFLFCKALKTRHRGDSDGTVRYGRVLPMSGTDGTHNKKAVMCTVNKDLEKIEGKFWRFIFDTENSLARKNSQHKIDLLIVFEAHH